MSSHLDFEEVHTVVEKNTLRASTSLHNYFCVVLLDVFFSHFMYCEYCDH